MKKILLLLVFSLPIALCAQLNFDFFAVRQPAPATGFNSGWGAGMNVLRELERSPFGSSLQLQLGGGYSIAGAGSKSIELVNANDVEARTSFNNTTLNTYGLSRISLTPGKTRRTVYVDFLAGIRITSATMCEQISDEDIDTQIHSYTGFMGGAGAGILFSLGKNTFLDVGLQWHGAAPGGRYVNMKSVTNTGDGISYQTMKAPTNVVVFKIGLHFAMRSTECCDVSGCRLRSHHVKGCTMQHHP